MLDKYTEYEFQVLAFTSKGDGPKSSVVVVRTKEDGKNMGVIKIKIWLCFSAVRFHNYAVLISYFAIWTACYGSQVHYYGFQRHHFMITNCNGPFKFNLLLLYYFVYLLRWF